MGVTTSRRTDPFAKPTAADAAREVHRRLSEPARVLTVQGPFCTSCGAHGRRTLRTLRSAQNGDGSVSRTTVCKVCGHRFVILVEYTPFGG